MKFTVSVESFKAALSTTRKVVERRNTYPILNNVLITAQQDQVRLRATDLDIEITMEFGAAIMAPGITTVNAGMLTDIIRKFPKDGTVTFDYDGALQTVKVSCGRSRFELPVLSPDSFPDIKAGNFHARFEMTAKLLCSTFGTVQFAISNEESRYYLNGVYMHPVERKDGGGTVNGINFVATDGHRMAQCFAPIDARTMAGIIVPKKTVAEIIGIAETLPDDAEVIVETSDTKIRFTAGTTVILSKLIEGTFPDYDRVTPKGNNRIAIVEPAKMAIVVDRISTIASDRGGKAVKLAFSQGTLKLVVTNPDHGTAEDELDVDFEATPEGGGLDIGFNARYLGDILDAVGKPKANLAMQDSGSPVLVTSTENPNVKFVLMPMRV